MPVERAKISGTCKNFGAALVPVLGTRRKPYEHHTSPGNVFFLGKNVLSRSILHRKQGYKMLKELGRSEARYSSYGAFDVAILAFWPGSQTFDGQTRAETEAFFLGLF